MTPTQCFLAQLRRKGVVLRHGEKTQHRPTIGPFDWTRMVWGESLVHT
jgi:hypothetical protein